MDKLSKRYLTYVVLAFAPAFHGCLWDSIHLDGSLDAENKPEEVGKPTSLENEEDSDETI